MTATATTMSSTKAIFKRATSTIAATRLFGLEELKEFYPTDGDMEHLWRTWCEARENDLEAMKNDLEDGTTTETIYEECAEVDEKNYDYIDHRVLSSRYHEHLLPYKVGVYRVLGFCDDNGRNPESDHVLTNEENYVADVLFERVGEYIQKWLLEKVKDAIAEKKE
jgi:hypothetical protein